jgi:hypothetical protein
LTVCQKIAIDEYKSISAKRNKADAFDEKTLIARYDLFTKLKSLKQSGYFDYSLNLMNEQQKPDTIVSDFLRYIHLLPENFNW